MKIIKKYECGRELGRRAPAACPTGYETCRYSGKVASLQRHSPTLNLELTCNLMQYIALVTDFSHPSENLMFILMKRPLRVVNREIIFFIYNTALLF